MTTELAPGIAVGHYRLERSLGRGGFCESWFARHASVPRLQVVLKIPLDDAAGTGRSMLAREADLLARFNHPCIPRVHDVELASDRPWLAIEHVDGRPMSELIAERLDHWSALQLWDRLLEVLAHVHDRGVVHRDLKPANVVVDAELRPHLIDFGLGRAPEAAPSDLDNSLASGRGDRVAGTPRYMAPEQRDGQDVDQRADLYSAGLILFELLVGRTPLPGERPGHVASTPAARAGLDALYGRLVAPVAERAVSASQVRAELAALFGDLRGPQTIVPAAVMEPAIPVLTPAPDRVQYYTERQGCGCLLGSAGILVLLISLHALRAGSLAAPMGFAIGVVLLMGFAWQRRIPYARCPNCQVDRWIDRDRGYWRCRKCRCALDLIEE